ncbi:bifunctional riboflavin kinase/FAD synthetase [Halanaerobium hydrogeniformans]|uniref:Riboflavin biosynthesis protein n=1 Tax=Halanaerobium hydrogeniformans TaxID=656519 RepID=E4RKT2_HALHG|nr:bifunctional riboflavin kinase/FAD synthetase [Halanaerobium hydrogeniformans]ADQ14752.1 riboflavin biosynthesis protein RibF [Halanaerobium hydrogeniformans]
MQIITSENYDNFRENNSVIAIGAFDGLHKGHQLIIEKCIETAKLNQLPSAVLSFNPHPLEVIPDQTPPPALVSRKQKLSILENMGLDYYFEQKFDEEFAGLSAVEFVENILTEKLKLDTVVVGSDFRFGKNNEANVEILNKLADIHGFKTKIISQLNANEDRISSTRIRNLLQKGKLNKAEELLGRPFQICGRVVHGKKIGRKLGFPTANLKLESDYVLPPLGVYAVEVHYKGQRFCGAANIGDNPTFNGVNTSFEIFILDFKDKLYQKRLCVDLVEYIRPEKEFADVEELKEQMRKDVLYTRKILC